MASNEDIKDCLTELRVLCAENFARFETRLDEIEKKIDQFQADIQEIEKDVASLKMKSAAIAGGASISIASLVQLVQFLMGHH